MSQPTKIKVGVQIWSGGTPDYRSWRDAVTRADAMGADYVFGYDHFHAPIFESPHVLAQVQRDVNNFEGWTALASWGEVTSRAEIGLLVTGIGYRNPDLLADMARTVDHISGGRLVLGLGAGWYQKDYTAYGYEYGTRQQRFDLFESGLARIQHRLTALQPKPLRDIPILIGGAGPTRTLPAAARYASIWHSFLPIEGFQESSRRLDELAAGFGRSGPDIERSVLWTDAGSADAYVAQSATIFTTEVRPVETGGRFDFTTLEAMLKWRESHTN
ncbi:LLM class F420-dependent oxidoreductase [Mycobacteroides abscessus]|uniref:Putative F420-dependent oxidoreductase, MSMEG_2906 family n=1 Tax=Mycobacteroides abscessus subsp. massiliense TaxID=1962118 RepID=A0A1U1GAZ2_9MYCO|nr:LLM class F420-dependent oxidoreductase [Mycobacteroides abscessus]EIU07727.1 putative OXIDOREDUCTASE [Mycobacteroides abscessus 5S-0421]EIU10224.1 putative OXIDOREDUCTASE [Mycobacteroides abscessus 5S-0304]EIU26234.1 putative OXIDOREDUCTASE [Mycobacteroides abscessus 5S-0817]EIU29486.1 putative OXIDOREDUCTASE [Mycobacteroides abscessus 5S-1212]EIU50154.1 putative OXIDOREDUCTASE [Mycobacteroides abscessus 5S-1215]